MIYHVTHKKDWEIAKQKGFYVAASLEKEGFIHSSTATQVASVLERYYKNTMNLVLLHIDETRLTSKFIYELAPSVNELFPHIFGPINLDAIMQVEDI